MEWNLTAPESCPTLEHYRGELGQWSIRTSQQFICMGSYSPPIPDGMSFGEYHKTMPEDFDASNDEHRLIFSRISLQNDVCYAPSNEHLKTFIARLHGEAPTETAEAILLAAGFERDEREKASYTLAVKKGYITCTIAQDGFHMTFQGKGAHRWWNLLRVNHGFNAHADGTYHPYFLPQTPEERDATAARYVVDALIEFVEKTRFVTERYR